jgi:hypothetical protein
MKIAMYSLLTLTFSALILPPTLSEDYLTKSVLVEGRVITFKEQKLKHLIESVEYHITKDSLEIQSLKNTN